MTSIIQKIYRPSMTVGQVYARVYGSSKARLPIGNVLELKIEHSEDVKTQEDMTALGGGTHSEVRRIKDAKVSMKLADLNITNLTRGVLGTAREVIGDDIVDEAHTVTLGGLVALEHIQPSAVVVKKGAAPVAAQGNYDTSPAGLRIRADAADLSDDDAITVSYTHPTYAVVEAMTTSAPELDLLFEGLNEADNGKPVIVNIWRVSQGITKTLALINKDHGALDVEGTLIKDPTKIGVGISSYYRALVV